MTELPLTRIAVSRDKQLRIREAVSKADKLADLARLASLDDVEALTALLADPEISGPIYTLPSKINPHTVQSFIERHLAERERGEGLLMVSIDEVALSAYHDIQVWPQWGACELGGAVRRDRQNRGQGGSGALIAFNWLFEVIGVDLICETAALDNIRTARLLESIGFGCKGQIESQLSDGSTRASSYWELQRSEWQSRSNE